MQYIKPENQSNQHFPPKIPHKIRQKLKSDPIAAQVVPSEEEEIQLPGYKSDPTGDLQSLGKYGIIRKYQGRALVLATDQCAVHCRYCFRRNLDLAGLSLKKEDYPAFLSEIKSDTSLSEVIFSGGDPLCLPEKDLLSLLKGCEAVSHIQRLRVHSRVPVVKGVSTSLLQGLQEISKPLCLVIQANHPDELDAETLNTFRQLKNAGLTLLNQSVLLKGVNDSAEILISLSEKLYYQGVLPYYLHQLDRSAGTHHFEVPEDRGKEIIKGLKRSLPGYLVPKYVMEKVGKEWKEEMS